MTSSKNTPWIAGAAVLVALILVAGYFLLLAPKRAEAADLQSQAQTVEATNVQLQQDTERLKAQFATLGEQRAALQEIRAQLPAAADVPALLRQFSAYAAGSGTTLAEVAPGALTQAAASTATGAASASGISEMPVSVTVTGSFAGTELFIKNLQADMQRYMLVDGVDVTAEGSDLKTVITGDIFVLQDAAAAATTQSAPAAGAGSTPVTTSTSTGTVN